MDGEGFDRLTRTVSMLLTRRAFAGVIGLGALGYSTAAVAKKKKRKGKPKKRPTVCAPQCAGRACNASDGCGGICDTCPSIGKACVGGVCQCFGGKQDCNGTCIAAGAQCCQSPGDCEAGEICVQNVCVTGQGNCAIGDNVCVNFGVCNSGGCICTDSTEGETRCALAGIGTCGDCQTSADCAAAHPNIPGVFCAKGIGGFGACCPTGQNICVSPCPN